MSLQNNSLQWGSISKLLHWLIVILIFSLGAVGLWMVRMPNSIEKIQIYALHKSFGITVLVLAIIRLAWRLYAGAPEPVAGTQRWQAGVASLTHGLLYALLLAIPLSGWLFNSAAGYPLQWFGLINLPALVSPNGDLRTISGAIHEWMFWLLLLVTAVHAGAALYHHLVLRDPTLARMLPRGWLRTAPSSAPPAEKDPPHVS